jgi:hypothetical protein
VAAEEASVEAEEAEEEASVEAEAAEEAVAEAVEEVDSTHVLLSVLYYCQFINKITKKLITLVVYVHTSNLAILSLPDWLSFSGDFELRALNTARSLRE